GPSVGFGSVVRMTAEVGSLIANPWVEHGVEHVNQQVDEQEYQDEQGHYANDDRRLALLRAAGHESSDTRNIEDRFGDDGTTEKRTEIDTQIGDHGDQRIAQSVDADHALVREALRLRGADVVAPDVLHQAGAGQPGGGREGERGQDERGEDQAGERIV